MFVNGKGVSLCSRAARVSAHDQCGWNRNDMTVGGRAEKEEG